jgi:hypothetical protein
MSVPYIRQWTPPSPDRQAALRAENEARRAEFAARRAAEAPARRAVLETGPPLRDIDVAMGCSCGCHPRPASVEVHDGGTTCPCQRTPAERKAALARFFAASAEVGEKLAEHNAQRDARVAEAVERLDVELFSLGGAAPFVIRGRVDGRGFFLRERHDVWRVEIAADDTPDVDPWTLPATDATIVVASGDSDDLCVDGRFDEVRALCVAVDSVRLFLLRRDCAHDGAARFCPHCGVDVADADRWRLHTAT